MAPDEQGKVTLNLKYNDVNLSPGYFTMKINGKKADDSEELIKVKFNNVCHAINLFEKVSDSFRIDFTQEIIACIVHSVKPDHSSYHPKILFSDDLYTFNVSWADEDEPELLSDVFHKIFKSDKMISTDNQIIAEHFCQNIKDKESGTPESRKMDQALKHPLFWSASQKIRFFEKIWGEQNAKPDTWKLTCTTNGHQYRLQRDDACQGHCSWTEGLLIPPEECETLKVKSPSSGSARVLPGTMKEFARNVSYWKRIPKKPCPKCKGQLFKNRDTCCKKKVSVQNTYEYDGDSWSDFLFFFRNIHAHFWEQDNIIQACFKYDDEDGYWDFFSKRFPGLLISLYKEYGTSVNFQASSEARMLRRFSLTNKLSNRAMRRYGLGVE